MSSLLFLLALMTPAQAGLGDGDKLADVEAPAELGTLPEGIGVAAGERAPDARVQDLSGRPVDLLSAAEGDKLLVFYKGGWCPFCNMNLRELAAASDAFSERGITPIAISVDLPAPASVTQANWDIPFPVLSDPELAAHTAWSVLDPLSGGERFMLGLAGADLKARTGQEKVSVAVASLFLVDEGGVVRWAHADLALKERPSVAQILAEIDTVLGGEE